MNYMGHNNVERFRPREKQAEIDLVPFEKNIGLELPEERQLICRVIKEGSLDDLKAFQERLEEPTEENRETIRSFYNALVKLEMRQKQMEGWYAACIGKERRGFGLIVKDRVTDQAGGTVEVPVAIGTLQGDTSGAWDMGVLVLPAYQHAKQGMLDKRPHIGKELIARLVDYAKIRGISEIVTESHNAAAIHSLEALGFEPSDIDYPTHTRTETWHREAA